MRYRYLNLNPFKNDTDDCTVRAIALFLNKTWDDVYIGLVSEGFLQKKMPHSDSVWKSFLFKNKCIIETFNALYPLQYTIEEFVLTHMYGDFLVKTNKHVVAIKNGYYYDTWNSGKEPVLYYFKKKDVKNDVYNRYTTE